MTALSPQGAGGTIYLQRNWLSSAPDRRLPDPADVYLTGTLDNTGDTLTLDDPALTFALDGGTIDGGTVETTNGAALDGARRHPGRRHASTAPST